jgi:hypothetical protein
MSEVLAHRVENFEHCKKPGDFFVNGPNPADDNRRHISFLCPCGCGMLCGVRVNDAGTTDNYCWGWNLDKDKPTCTPSININNGH